MMEIDKFHTKSQIADIMGVTTNTLRLWLRDSEKEIKEIFPKYKRTSKLLPPAVARFMLEEYAPGMIEPIEKRPKPPHEL